MRVCAVDAAELTIIRPTAQLLKRYGDHVRVDVVVSSRTAGAWPCSARLLSQGVRRLQLCAGPPANALWAGALRCSAGPCRHKGVRIHSASGAVTVELQAFAAHVPVAHPSLGPVARVSFTPHCKLYLQLQTTRGHVLIMWCVHPWACSGCVVYWPLVHTQ